MRKKNNRACGFQNKGEMRPGRGKMNGGGAQVGSDAESFPGDGQRLSCKGDNCRELLLGGPVSGGVRNLNRSQGIYDLATCGRESAHRWEEGWTHGWRQGVLSGSVPPKNTSGTCGARSQAAFLQLQQTFWKVISWPHCRGAQLCSSLGMLLPVSHGGLLTGTASCLQERDKGKCWSPLVCPKHECI